MSALETLIRRMPGARPTRSQFAGLAPHGVPVPRNVVLFTRNHVNGLHAGALASPRHQRYVLICCLQGAGTVCLDAHRIRLEPGRALLVYPFQIHLYADLAERQIRWLFVSFEGEALGLDELRSVSVGIGESAALHLKEVFEHWELGKADICYSLGLLLSELKRSRKSTSRQTADREPGVVGCLGEVNALLYRDERGAWSIADLAEELGKSAGHLRAQFRKETGLSLGKYLEGVRINRACALLMHTSERVGDIGLHCGYESVYTFSRAFKRVMGVSPRSYRAGDSA